MQAKGAKEMEKGEQKWFQKPSNWLVAVACIIMVPMLLMNLWIIIQSKTNADSVPSVFGYKPFIVLSGSMETDIHKGDLIITKIVKDPTKLVVDDIIAFRDAENTVTTHRIIDIVEKEGENYFITKGDNNTSQDLNLVALTDVEGIYVGRIPGIGSMMSSLSQPTTILVLVLVITVAFGIGFAISNKKQRDLERLEFLEYKRMKELETKTKKTKSIKAEEDEELLEDEEEEETPKPKKKASTTSNAKKSTTTSKTSSKKTKSK